MPGQGGDLRGYNLYSYCFNNPIMYTDENGNWPQWLEGLYDWAKETNEDIVVTQVRLFNIFATEEAMEYAWDSALSNFEAEVGIPGGFYFDFGKNFCR